MKERAFGSIVASAVAGLFVMSAAHASDTSADAAKVPFCASKCAGKGDCKGAKNDCKGHNAKGEGFLKVADEGACKKAGGTWTKPAKG